MAGRRSAHGRPGSLGRQERPAFGRSSNRGPRTPEKLWRPDQAPIPHGTGDAGHLVAPS
ncbi:hypothetical protein KCH_32530 [Kitasatospora cheerisanensis KCTC 2395]|uniref:Uncharacterized protein n=1 Tax=Kitasatospora cheerisanensis KCTC 2395 TaxID=1348663 RepID=A0A066YYT6_9ACTN|nr:hypothetical protein KCH_32530 [Kitasatospora cheerisanensis KCTC 2395]